LIENPYIGMPIKLGNNRNRGCCPNNNGTDMGLNFDNMKLGDLPLAMSYVPFQRWQSTYPLEKALQRGTIFPELDLPFKGGMSHE